MASDKNSLVVSNTGTSTTSSSVEISGHDKNSACLKFVRELLLGDEEEDMEEPPSWMHWQDSFALQSAEKSFYEVLICKKTTLVTVFASKSR